MMTLGFWNRFSKMMMALSLALLILGIAFAVRAVAFLHRAVRTQATITELIETKGQHGTMYAPVFVFSDPEGKTRKVVSSVSSFPPVGTVGDKIAILYDPENPKRTAENTFFSVWGISAILGGCGAFYLILFWLVWLFTKRKISTLNIG
jgi:hypothetical protein